MRIKYPPYLIAFFILFIPTLVISNNNLPAEDKLHELLVKTVHKDENALKEFHRVLFDYDVYTVVEHEGIIKEQGYGDLVAKKDSIIAFPLQIVDGRKTVFAFTSFLQLQQSLGKDTKDYTRINSRQLFKLLKDAGYDIVLNPFSGGYGKRFTPEQINALLAQVDIQKTQRLTGKDWLLMSDPEKVVHALTAIETLQVKGVPFGKSPNDYIKAINNRLVDTPGLASADVTSILASIIYETEPASRETLDQIKKKPEVKKIEMH